MRRLLRVVMMVLAMVLLSACALRGTPRPPTPPPTRTAEPLLPTRTSSPVAPETSPTATPALIRTPAPTATETAPPPPPTATGTALPTSTGSVSAFDPTITTAADASPASPSPSPTLLVAAPRLARGRARLGAGVAFGSIADYPVEAAGLNLGWYLNWGVQVDPRRPGGAAFWQMVRVTEVGYYPDAATIRAAAAANPGAFWIIGNEPDVIWQDNVTPEQYAERYHELHRLLKSADPTCQVVIGGVSQPTPLRLAYLERVLTTYRARYGKKMPVDVWNVHGFILREERGSWGVDIPPGMDDSAGVLYEIDDHDDLSLFRSQILTFRRWMADHGERDKPLVVSEYGILMPADYGFGPAEVRTFMEGSFDFLATATDANVGYPQDGNRLVQWWCWYSLASTDDYYPTGNLFDPATKALTPLGQALAEYSLP